jgi:hypothetical protein
MAVSKFAPDITLDTMLDFIAECDEMYVCSGSTNPADRAAAIAAALVTVAMVAGEGNDYNTADDTSGRKVTVVAQAGEDIDVSETATCIVLCKLSDTSLRYITTCTPQALTSGGTVDVPAFKIGIADPT